jgi:hypothetical protein
MLGCGGLPMLVMPTDCQAPGCLGAWKCERIGPNAVTEEENETS